MIRKVEISNVDTSKLPVLSNEEKNALFLKIKEGDLEARERFIHGNLRLVLSVLQRFSGRCENMDDLFQVGCVGLIKSIDNFDLSLNVQFSTYRDNNPIRVSRSIRDLAYKALQAKEKLTKELNKEPTVDQIAKEVGVPREEIVFSFEAIQDPLSLQEPVYNDGSESLYIMDQVSDHKESDEHWADSLTIEQAMKRLNEREKMIITKRFFDGRTQMEVAKEIGISQAQVSRLEKDAIGRIKKLYK